MGNLKSLLQALSITLKRIRLNHKRERRTGLTGEERNIELFRQDSILYDAHDLVEAIGSVIDMRDHYTYGHSIRVGNASQKMAELLGLSSHEIENIHLAGHLHDIGKVALPDSILLKQGKLSLQEFERIEEHPVTGYKILRKLRGFEKISAYVLHHHERYDGKGYPEGLKGSEIPLGSRIIAVADAIDAMLSDRPYRKALTMEETMKEVERQKGKQFDPELATLFLREIDVLAPYFSKDGLESSLQEERNLKYQHRENTKIQPQEHTKQMCRSSQIQTIQREQAHTRQKRTFPA